MDEQTKGELKNDAVKMGVSMLLVSTLPEDWKNAHKSEWSIRIPERFVVDVFEIAAKTKVVDSAEKMRDIFEDWLLDRVLDGIAVEIKNIPKYLDITQTITE